MFVKSLRDAPHPAEKARRARRKGGWRTPVGFAVALTWLVPALGQAAISEPDVIVFGTFGQFGLPSAVGTSLEARLQGTGELLAATTVRATASNGEIYALHLPMETASSANEARSPGTVRELDVVELYSITPTATRLIEGTITITTAGLLLRNDLSLVGKAADLDDDGIVNNLDNCGGISNPDQFDLDGNGVGDACEDLSQKQIQESLIEINAVRSVGTPDGGTTLEFFANSPDSTGFGTVPYDYSTGATEVTNIQYRDFLTAVAQTDDPFGLFNASMATNPRGGILRAGDVGNYSYQVKPNMADKPVNFVSWLDAARFVNWLQSGQPMGPGASAATHTGTFNLNVDQPEINATLTHGVSGWSLPTEDEWYKGAYYDAAVDRYSTYAHGTDILPIEATADGLGTVTNPGPEVANYNSAAIWNEQVGHVTSVGSTGAVSHFGLVDAGGNVAEWLGADAEGGMRLARGGSYSDAHFALASTASNTDIFRDSQYEGADTGFRVVFLPQPVPEPSMALALLVGASCTLILARRKA